MAVNEYGAKTVLSRRTFVGGAMLAGTAIALFGLGGCAPEGHGVYGFGRELHPRDLHRRGGWQVRYYRCGNRVLRKRH